MDANELKRLLDENCDQLARILDECRSGPAENVSVVEVMEPVLCNVEQALTKTPPFSKRPFPDDPHTP